MSVYAWKSLLAPWELCGEVFCKCTPPTLFGASHPFSPQGPPPPPIQSRARFKPGASNDSVLPVPAASVRGAEPSTGRHETPDLRQSTPRSHSGTGQAEGAQTTLCHGML